jgi:hypothetical protein
MHLVYTRSNNRVRAVKSSIPLAYVKAAYGTFANNKSDVIVIPDVYVPKQVVNFVDELSTTEFPLGFSVLKLFVIHLLSIAHVYGQSAYSWTRNTVCTLSNIVYTCVQKKDDASANANASDDVTLDSACQDTENNNTVHDANANANANTNVDENADADADTDTDADADADVNVSVNANANASAKYAAIIKARTATTAAVVEIDLASRKPPINNVASITPFANQDLDQFFNSMMHVDNADVTAFCKWLSVFDMDSTELKKACDDVNNMVPKQCSLRVFMYTFENDENLHVAVQDVDVGLLDIEMGDFVGKLADMGLHISVVSVFYIPSVNGSVKHLINELLDKKYGHTISDVAKCTLAIKKCVNDHLFASDFIVFVMDFMIRNYEFDASGKVDITNAWTDISTQWTTAYTLNSICNVPPKISATEFVKIINYIGIPVVDRKLMFLKRKDNNGGGNYLGCSKKSTGKQLVLSILEEATSSIARRTCVSNR